MSQTTASSPLVVRRDAAKALKDRIGWSWQKLAERLGLNPSQGNALSLAKRLISEQDLAWLAALADAVDALPRPEPMPDVVTVAPTQGMEQFVREAVPMDAEAESRGRQRARMETAAAIADQYATLEAGDLTPEQRAGGRAALSSLALAMGLVPEVRKLMEDRRAAPRTQPEPPPHIGEGAADPPAWSPPMPRAEAPGRVPF